MLSKNARLELALPEEAYWPAFGCASPSWLAETTTTTQEIDAHTPLGNSTKAVQRRVRAIAEERKIPPADFAKLLHKRISTFAVMQFCTKHKISYDWLLCGDLKGLARMEQRRKDAEAAASHSGGAQAYPLQR